MSGPSSNQPSDIVNANWGSPSPGLSLGSVPQFSQSVSASPPINLGNSAPSSGNLLRGAEGLLGDANTGLALYRSLTEMPRGRDILGSNSSPYIPASMPGGGGASRSGINIPGQSGQIPTAAGYPKGANPNSSHFDTLRQILGVYKG